MKDATYWKEYRAKKKAEKEVNHLPASRLDIPENIRSLMGKVTDPDKFIGANQPAYYETCCIFCGSPNTSLVKRNGFSGHLCEAHSPL